MDFLDRYSKAILISALTVVTALVYANSLPNSFHYDDFHGIVRNPTIRDLRHIASYFTDPSTFTLVHDRDWRPVLQITYALNYLVGGLNPIGFRLFNLFIHIASALIIYLTVTEIDNAHPAKLPKDSHWRMVVVGMAPAALFAVHSVNSEVVNYIWARSSLLAAFFYLAAFYCFLRGPLSEKERKNLLWHLGGLISYILGLATKATVITLPAILVLHELLLLRSPGASPIRFFILEPSRLKKYIPVATICLGYIALRSILLPETFTRVVRPEEISSSTYLLSSFRAWVYYLRLFLWPAPLLVDFHGFGWSYSLWDSRVLLCLVIIITIFSLAWWVRRSEPLITFFTFWFFIALLPESSFIPLTEPINGYRPYLAYVGLSVLITILGLKASLWLWNRATHNIKNDASRFWITYSLALGIILSILTLATIKRNLDWRDELSLWTDVLRKDPASSKAYLSLGVHFLEKEDYPRAQGLFEKAIQIAPRNSHAYMLRGYLNFALDRDQDALSDFTSAIHLEPRSAYNFFYRGELYRKIGQQDKALEDYRHALVLKPHLSDAYFGLAMAHQEKGETPKAIEACKKLVTVDPTDSRGYSCLGSFFVAQGHLAEAIKVYQSGLARVSEDDELWYSLGVAYSETGMYREAAAAFTKSSELRRKSLEGN